MSVIIRLQGLSWSASAMDIRNFFKGLSIPPGGVRIIGGEKGDAFIAFSTDEDARQAMMLTNSLLNDSPVQLFLSSKTEMQNTITQAKDKPASAPAPAPSVNQNLAPSAINPNIPSVQQISQAFPAIGQLMGSLGLQQPQIQQANQFAGGFPNIMTQGNMSSASYMNSSNINNPPSSLSVGQLQQPLKTNSAKQFEEELPGEYSVGGISGDVRRNDSMIQGQYGQRSLGFQDNKFQPNQQGFGNDVSRDRFQGQSTVNPQVNQGMSADYLRQFGDSNNINQNNPNVPFNSNANFLNNPQNNFSGHGKPFQTGPNEMHSQQIGHGKPFLNNQNNSHQQQFLGGRSGFPHVSRQGEQAFIPTCQPDISSLPPSRSTEPNLTVGQQRNEHAFQGNRLASFDAHPMNVFSAQGPIQQTGIALKNTFKAEIPFQPEPAFRQPPVDKVPDVKTPNVLIDLPPTDIPLANMQDVSDSSRTPTQDEKNDEGRSAASRNKDISRIDSRERDRSRDNSNRRDSPRDRDRRDRDRDRGRREDDRRYRRDRERERDRDKKPRDRDGDRSSRSKDLKDNDRKNSPSSDVARRSRKRSLSPNSKSKTDNDKKVQLEKSASTSSEKADSSRKTKSRFDSPLSTTSISQSPNTSGNDKTTSSATHSLFPVIPPQNSGKGLLGEMPLISSTVSNSMQKHVLNSESHSVQLPGMGNSRSVGFGNQGGPILDNNQEIKKEEMRMSGSRDEIPGRVPDRRPLLDINVRPPSLLGEKPQTFEYGHSGQPAAELSSNRPPIGDQGNFMEPSDRLRELGNIGESSIIRDINRQRDLRGLPDRNKGFIRGPPGRDERQQRPFEENLQMDRRFDRPPGQRDSHPGRFDGLPGQGDAPLGFDGPQRRLEGPPGRFDGPPGPRDGPPGRFDGPPGPRDGPPGRFDGHPGPRDGPPGRFDGPSGPRDGPPGRFDGPSGPRDGPKGRFDGPPGPRDGPPGRFNGPPGPRDGPPGRFDGPPGLRDGPPGRFEGPPGLRDGPPGQRDGPPGRFEGPPGLRDGPPGQRDGLPVRFDGPPGPRDGPQGRVDGPPGRFDGPMGLREGPRGRTDGPPGRFDGPPGRRDGPNGGFDGPVGNLDGPVGRFDGPPGLLDTPPGRFDGPPGLFDGPQGRFDGPPGRFDREGGGFDRPPSLLDVPQGRFEGPPGRFDRPPALFDGPPGPRDRPLGRDGQLFDDRRRGSGGQEGPYSGPAPHERHGREGRDNITGLLGDRPPQDLPHRPFDDRNEGRLSDNQFMGDGSFNAGFHGNKGNSDNRGRRIGPPFGDGHDFQVPQGHMDRLSMDSGGETPTGGNFGFRRDVSRGPDGMLDNERGGQQTGAPGEILSPSHSTDIGQGPRNARGHVEDRGIRRGDELRGHSRDHGDTRDGRSDRRSGPEHRTDRRDQPGREDVRTSQVERDRERRSFDREVYGRGERRERTSRIDSPRDRSTDRDRDNSSRHHTRDSRDRQNSRDDRKEPSKRDHDEKKSPRRHERSSDPNSGVNTASQAAADSKTDLKATEDQQDAKDKKKDNGQKTNALCSVVLENIPVETTYKHIRRLFSGLDLPKDGIKIINDNQGKRIGKAYVRFGNQDSFKKGLLKDKTRMGAKIMSIRPVPRVEFDAAIDSYMPSSDDDEEAPPLDMCNSLSATLRALKGEPLKGGKLKSAGSGGTTKHPKSTNAEVTAQPGDKNTPVASNQGTNSTDQNSTKEFVVKITMLPEYTRSNHILNLFKGCQIARNGEAVFIESSLTKPCTGLCCVEFANEASYRKALSMRKVFDGKTINMIPGSKKDIENFVNKMKEEIEKKPANKQTKDVTEEKKADSQARVESNVKTVDDKQNDNVEKQKVNINQTCLRVRNIPKTMRVFELRGLVDALNVSIRVAQTCHDAVGKPIGEGYLEFASSSDVEKALVKNNTYIGNNKITVQPVTKQEMIDNMRLLRQALQPEVPTTQAVFFFVKASNLPKNVSTGEIINFFHGFNPAPESIRLNIDQINDPPDCSSALVGFHTRQEAELAIESTNGNLLRSKSVTLTKVII